MAYKNAKITPEHVKHVVRECWKRYEMMLFAQRFESQIPLELGLEVQRKNYEDQRKLAENAIAALPEDRRKEFVLP